jgi:inosine-uridine nucleoside N-ribohydrolase
MLDMPHLRLAILCAVLLVAIVRSSDADTRRPVVICTDIAMGLDCTNVFGSPPSAADPDDAWALAWALNHPDWNVLGVIVSFGNCACETPPTSCDPPHAEPGEIPCAVLDEQVEIARWVVEACGRDVPVHRGASRRFSIDGPAPEGTRAAFEGILAHPEPVTIIGIGPATDPAYLVRDLADVGRLDRVERLVLEMGQFGPWAGQAGFVINGTPVSDYNFRGDPHAVRWLFETPDVLPETTLVPFNAIRFGYIAEPGLDLLAAVDRATTDRVAADSRAWLTKWVGIFGEPGFHLWDLVCMLAIVDGAEFDTVPVRATVECLDDRPSLQLTVVKDGSRITCASHLAAMGPPLLSQPVTFASADATAGTSDQNVIAQLALKAWLDCPPTANPCAGDLNGDGRVDGADLGLMIAMWGACP